MEYIDKIINTLSSFTKPKGKSYYVMCFVNYLPIIPTADALIFFPSSEANTKSSRCLLLA